MKKVIGNNFFGEDTDDLAYLWFNKLLDDKVEMDLTFFIKEGQFFIRKEEKHIQYIHTISDIENSLIQSGFELLYKEADCGEIISDNSLRINFGAKINGQHC